MKTPRIVTVIGSKSSGKTTTVECIVSGLTQKGFRVGSIKHIHHDFTIDREGTDTFRHARAGSKIVAGVSKTETAVIIKDDPEQTLSSILDFMTKREVDIVITEGLHASIGQRSDVFKIVVARDIEDLRERMRGTTGPILAISGLVAEGNPCLAQVDIPVIDTKTDCPKLIELVEKKVLHN